MNNIIQEYFKAFSNKDLSTLEQLYDSSVILWEWGQNIFVGKSEVLKANMELFNSTEQLMVTVQGYANNGSKHYCEIGILLNNKLISVVDVITVTDNKITSIQAYKGF
jgi:ketosteroid isomerase-like protein